MKLHSLSFPSFDQNQQKNPNLTLIHGWGAESRVWQDWAQSRFGNKYSLTLIDLPGFGDSSALPKSDTLEDDWIEALAKTLPKEPTHLLGWSLGGLLAQQIALRYPQKILSLTCLTTTPRFTQNDGWTRSVNPQIIGDFIGAISIETVSVLKNFWRLQLQGVDNSRQLMKDLVKHMSERKIPKLVPLNQGLILLKDMDNREQLKDIQAPTFWLLGEKDPLIPQDIRENLTTLQPNAKVMVLAGGSHIPFFSQPDETAAAILDFLAQH